MRRDRVRQVARRRTRHGIKIEFLCLAERDGYHPVFERERRVADRIVFDIEFRHAERVSQVFRVNERCEAGVEPVCRFTVDWQELDVSPQACRAPLNGASGDGLSDDFVVVVDFQRAKAEFANVERFFRVCPLTFAAF